MEMSLLNFCVQTTKHNYGSVGSCIKNCLITSAEFRLICCRKTFVLTMSWIRGRKMCQEETKNSYNILNFKKYRILGCIEKHIFQI